MLLVGGLVVLAVVRVVDGQRASLRALDDRFQARAESAADFVSTYVDDLAERQQMQGIRSLAAPEVDHDDFQQVVVALDLSAAVLLDGDGRVLHTHPDGGTPGAHGPHLRDALAGRTTVSEVLSATDRGTVVAIAVAFETPTGRRVLNGSYPPDATPLGRFLDNAVPIPSSAAWLVDRHGRLVANSGPWDARATLERVEPGLPSAAGSGDYEHGGEHRHFTSARVAGTPWRIVQTVAHDKLYAPVRSSQLVPRLTLVALFATALFALLLFWRLLRSESRLASAVRTDALTGLPNRRSIEEHLRSLVAAAVRRGRPSAVLVVDVDRFKQVNDTVGHLAGDDVLAACADRMSRALRAGDVLGRWGGEEFLVLLPDATPEQALVAAERLRRAVHHPLVVGDCVLAPSVSIGVAAVVSDDVSHVLRAADAALYEAKSQGRNRVEAAGPATPVQALVPARA